MDIDVQNKFITAFQERMNFFIPLFDEMYEKKTLMKCGKRSKIFLYWNKMNNTHYAVKEINLKQDQELEWIQKMIDSFFTIDTQVCNKKNIVRSEGFYYRFNRSKISSNANMQSFVQNVTIDFYMVFEKCDGSLNELFNLSLNTNSNTNNNAISKEKLRKNSNTAAAINNKNKSPKLGSLSVHQNTEKKNSINLQKSTHFNQNEEIEIQLYQQIAGNADQVKDIQLKNEDFKIKLEDLDFFNIYSVLKDLILQIHELDGSALYIESFDLSDIMFCYNNNKGIDFKFSKVTTQQCDTKQQMKSLAEIIILVGLGNQFKYNQLNEQYQINQQQHNLQQAYPHNQQSIHLHFQQPQSILTSQHQILQSSNNNNIKNSKTSNNQNNPNNGTNPSFSISNDCQNANQNIFSSNQQSKSLLNNQNQNYQNQHSQGQNQNSSNQNIQQNNQQIQNNNCQNNSYNKTISFYQNKSQNQINSYNQNFSQNTTHANLPNNQSLNISQNSSPSSHKIKVPQPVFSNSVSFKDVEQRVQNQYTLNLNQSQTMQISQIQSSSAGLISGSSSCNQIANPLANSINQDHCIEESNLMYQQQHKEFLLENLKLLQKKFERDDIMATVTQFCKLIENMIKGQTINQCYYQILKIYNAREFFFEFNQQKLSFINPNVQSLSLRNISNAQLLFFPLNNVLRLSDCNRPRSIVNDDRTSSTSSSQNKKRSSMQRNQIQENVDAIATYINSLKDNTVVTLVQNFSNLVNAIKSKKKKLRFEKYLTQIQQFKYFRVKEMRFLKTIDPIFCAVDCISVDFGNFYLSEAMKLTGDCFESLINIQGLDLNFDYWNETSEEQFIYMIQKLSNLKNLRLFIASLSYQFILKISIGQRNNYHSPNFAKNSIQALCKFLENMTELICLELDLTGYQIIINRWNTLKPEDINELLITIKKCNKLQQLQLTLNDIVTASNQTINHDTLMLFTQFNELPVIQQIQLSLRGWGINKRITEQNLLEFVCRMSLFPVLNQGVQISFENQYQNMMDIVSIDEEVIKANLLEDNQNSKSQKILQEIQQQLPNISETLKQTKSITLTYQNIQIFILL